MPPLVIRPPLVIMPPSISTDIWSIDLLIYDSNSKQKILYICFMFSLVILFYPGGLVADIGGYWWLKERCYYNVLLTVLELLHRSHVQGLSLSYVLYRYAPCWYNVWTFCFHSCCTGLDPSRLFRMYGCDFMWNSSREFSIRDYYLLSI